jgi:predicted 3-demethylubiquinone-9 3-methyltransferase (glyoxalase superfamily)
MSEMKKITPFLWFDTQAGEAAELYCSIFKRSKIVDRTLYGEGGMGKKGSVMTVRFVLDGQEFVALNGGPMYQFNEATSFMISCKDQEEIDYFWGKLTDGGSPGQCGWCKDRFGVSWQVIPENLGSLLSSPKAVQAMLSMRKLEIAKLKAAG